MLGIELGSVSLGTFPCEWDIGNGRKALGHIQGNTETDATPRLLPHPLGHFLFRK